MQVNEIPEELWKQFFDRFSRTHDLARASARIFGPGTGSHTETEPLPFAGISYDEKGSSAGSIDVMLGAAPETHVTHTITQPTNVWHKSGDGPEVLEVRSADGDTLVLQLA